MEQPMFRDLKENEIWKDIPGFINRYQASNLGNIRSLNYEGHKNKIKNLKIHKRKDGYLQVGLNIGKKHIKCLVHRLIAQTFLKNLQNLEYVNHKNGIKTDNNIINLEWVSPSENTIHAYKYNLMKKKYGKEHPSSKRVAQYNLKHELIAVYNSISEAERELNINHVSCCCNGKRKTAGGYIWEVLACEI